MNRESLKFAIDRQGAPRVARLGYVYALHDDVAVFELELNSKRCAAVGGVAVLRNEAEVPLIRIEATGESTGLAACDMTRATRVVFPDLIGWEAHVSGGAKYTFIVTLLKTPAGSADTGGAS